MRSILYAASMLSLLACGCARSPAPAPQADVEAILARMRAAWDRPQSPLDAGPVAVAGDYAVADWTQGRMGGRALLARGNDGWITVLCAGDGIRRAEGLRAVGVPAGDAQALATRLADAESRVPVPRLAKMATFAGMTRMADSPPGEHRAPR